MPDDEEMPEIFRRFFGQPGQPGSPSPGGPRRRGTSLGSGFIISADGYVLTNHHVIDGADEVIVHLVDRRELKAKVIGSDPMSDVALLKVEASDLPVLRIGDSRNAQARPVGGGDRLAVRLRSFGHRRHRQRAWAGQASTPSQQLRALHPDRRRDQPRQLRRPAVQHARRGGRHQFADLLQFRRLHGRELRDPDRGGDECGAAAARPAARSGAASWACRSGDVDARAGRGTEPAATARRLRRRGAERQRGGEGRHQGPATSSSRFNGTGHRQRPSTCRRWSAHGAREPGHASRSCATASRSTSS